jgi:exosortase/archaeosortase family protein
LSLALGGSVLFLLVERFLDINMLAACLFALASYGLLGLWLSPARWRQGLPAILLLIGVLPFGEHLQTFVGYPMRIFTAELVRRGLTAVGVASVGVDTILVFENGISHVDLPCSGVKSLWTGLLFLLAATWVEQRPLTPYWFFVAVLLLPILFLANFMRVAILVMVGQVLNLPLLAEMLHVPLGVLGFMLACATAVALLKWRKPLLAHDRQAINRANDVIYQPIKPDYEPEKIKSVNVKTSTEVHLSDSVSWFIPDLIKESQLSGAPRLARGFNPWRSWPAPIWLSLTLIALIFIMIQLYAPRPLSGLSTQSKSWTFPEGLQTESLPLKPDENEWLTRDGAESAERLRFSWADGEISGSLILISSKTWRAHHRPERCFEVYGLSLAESRTHLVNTTMPIRFVALSADEQSRQYSASYWFQSSQQTSDDYGSRIWSDVSLARERWVLVSILFDGRVDPNDPEVEGFYLALHESVAEYLSN